MINIVSYAAKKGSGNGSGSGGGGSVTNYNTYTGIQPLYLWGNYFDGSQDISGPIDASQTNITVRDLYVKNILDVNIVDCLSAVTEYFKAENAYIENDLTVSGNTKIIHDLEVDGNTNLKNNLTVSGDTTIGDDITVVGDSNIGGNQDIAGGQRIGETLLVSGHSTLSGGTTTTDIQSENITNTGKIRTKDLEVTGTAHFFELIIDKIKAAGGAVLLTPADGFDIDYVEDVTNGKKLYFRSTDKEGKGIMNMWKVGDQAICQSFNEARVGTSYNVSNKYWWSLVTDCSEQPVQKTISGETNDYHYITISTQEGYDENDVPYYDGTINCEVGDSVAMLGYRGTDDNDRQSAIYLAAYRSIDLGLTAPHFAEYKGINDFNLASHRGSYIDATGAKFIGGLWVDANTSVENYVTSATTEVRNEFKFDIDGLTSRVAHTSRPNILPNNDWTDQDDNALYQDNDEEYNISGSTECTGYPPEMYLDAGTYTMSVYGIAKYKTILYGETSGNLDNSLPVETMINFDDTWNDEPRSQTIFIAPVDGYYKLGVELMGSYYAGDTPYHDYIDETSGSGATSGNTGVETTITLNANDVKINRTSATSHTVYPADYSGRIIYKSSNPDVISVDEYGNITGNGEGHALIYAFIPEAYTGGHHYLSSESYKNVQCTVSGETTTTMIAPSAMMINSSRDVTTMVTPSDYPGTTVLSSSDTSIATISGKTVNAVGLGNVRITATSPSVTESGYTWLESSVYVDMNVNDYTHIQTSVSISIDDDFIYSANTTTVHATINPTGLDYYFVSSDPSIATVDENGVVRGVSTGTCNIIAIIPDQVSGTTMYDTSSASTSVMYVEEPVFENLDIKIEGSSDPVTVTGNTQGTIIKRNDNVDVDWSYSPAHYPTSGITFTSNYTTGLTITNTGTTVSGDERVGTFRAKVTTFELDSDKVRRPVITINGGNKAFFEGQDYYMVNGDSNSVTLEVNPEKVTWTSSGTAYLRNQDSTSSSTGKWYSTLAQSYTTTGGTAEFSTTPTQLPSSTFVGGKNNVLTVDFSELTGVTQTIASSLSSMAKVTSIILPPNLTTIGRGTFFDCTKLTSITIPSSVTSIGDSAFSSCKSLTSITIPNGVTIIDEDTFFGCTNLTSVTLPTSLTTIKTGAFNSCENLVSITIPSNVTKIENTAFEYCWKLMEVIINRTTPPTIYSDTFEDTYSTGYKKQNFMLRVPSSAVNTYRNNSTYVNTFGYNNIVAIS